MTENSDIKAEIKKLAELQVLDTEIFDLSSRKESLPNKIKQLDSSLSGELEKVKAAEEELKKIQLSREGKEMDMQSKEEEIRKHQGALYQLKTNKEYKALEQEIESKKADVSLLEEEIISLLDGIETQQNAVKELKVGMEKEKVKIESERKLIMEEEKSLSSRIDELTRGRTELAGGLDKDVLAQYQRILENRGRTALAAINGELCGECNMQLRPQIINEAKLKKTVVVCENCSRILYAKD